MTHGTWPQQRKSQHLSPSDVVEIDPIFLLLIQIAPKHSLCSSKMRTVGAAQVFRSDRLISTFSQKMHWGGKRGPEVDCLRGKHNDEVDAFGSLSCPSPRRSKLQVKH